MGIQPVTIYRTSNGEILRWDDIIDGVPPTTVTGEAYINDYWDAETQYISGAAAVDRPYIDETLVDAEVYSIAPGETLSFTSINGTKVVDHDTNQTFTTSGTEPIQVTGSIDIEFDLTIQPPFPYQTARITVIINAD